MREADHSSGRSSGPAHAGSAWPLLVAMVAVIAVGSGCSGSQVAPGDGGPPGAPPPDLLPSLALTAPAHTWTYVPFPDTACGNGQPAGLAVNLNPDSQDAVIFFEGGGLCWNKDNCVRGKDATDYTFNGVSEQTVLFEVGTNKKGIFNLDTPLNPFRSWNYVYIPYCTGDFHFGTRVADYGIHHVGRSNVEAYLRRLVPTLSGKKQIVLTGVSAGAIGALLNHDAVQRAFGDLPVHLITDAGPPMPQSVVRPALLSTLFSAWGASMPPDCSSAADLAGLARCLAQRFPDRRFGFLGSEADWLWRRLLARNLDGSAGTTIEISDWFQGLQAIAKGAPANLKVLWVASDQHVFLDKDQQLMVKGTRLTDWVSRAATGDAAWTSLVDDGDLGRFEPNPLAGGVAFSSPRGDEKYGYPTAPGYTSQGDLRTVTMAVSGGTLTLQIQTGALTNTTQAANGFDHVAFTTFFDLHSGHGQAALPQLQASAPPGFKWDLVHRLSAGQNAVFDAVGADATHFGAKKSATPGLQVKAATRTVTVTYNAADYGVGAWSDVGVYVTTWDVDGSGNYLGSDPGGGPALFKGPTSGPHIQDSVGPVAAPRVLTVAGKARGERYPYPTSPGFDGTQNILSATVQSSGPAVALTLRMRALSTVWMAPNGFDHVSFQIFFSLPGKPGATALPKVNATMPGGLAWWRYSQVYGFANQAWSPEGASATMNGTALSVSPAVGASVQPDTSVFLSYPPEFLPGVASLSGATLYITTWDYDGIGDTLRPIAAQPAEWTYGGGQPTDAKIQDAMTVVLP